MEFVRHPRARRYVIRVRSDGTVRVTLPRWGSRRHAEHERQRQEVEKQRQRRAGLPPHQLTESRRRAARELPVRLRELAGLHGLSVDRVSVRNQRWRWGSCSATGHVCLNWRLVLMPDFVRDYVLIHELMHLKKLDHSPAFWTLVADACPDYQSARAWLRDHRYWLDA
jgi:predicted metal-dependent hydrolase